MNDTRSANARKSDHGTCFITLFKKTVLSVYTILLRVFCS